MKKIKEKKEGEMINVQEKKKMKKKGRKCGRRRRKAKWRKNE